MWSKWERHGWPHTHTNTQIDTHTYIHTYNQTSILNSLSLDHVEYEVFLGPAEYMFLFTSSLHDAHLLTL